MIPGIVFPMLAAVAHSTDVLLDRFIMTRHRLGHRQFTIVMFLGLYFWSSLATVFLGGVGAAAFTSRYLWELVAVIGIASVYNMFYYQGIEKKHVEEFEPILMLMPLAVILAGALAYPSERSPITLAAATVAALAITYPYLYGSRRKSRWDIFDWRLVIVVILTAVEAVLLKDLLTVYNPATLYAARTGLILTTLFVFYTGVRPIPLVVISKRHIKEIVLLSIAPTIYFISMLYAFQQLGIVLSTLVFLIYPVFSYTGARLFLKEKLHWKNLVSGAIVLTCVVVAVVSLNW